MNHFLSLAALHSLMPQANETILTSEPNVTKPTRTFGVSSLICLIWWSAAFFTASSLLTYDLVTRPVLGSLFSDYLN